MKAIIIGFTNPDIIILSIRNIIIQKCKQIPFDVSDPNLEEVEKTYFSLGLIKMESKFSMDDPSELDRWIIEDEKFNLINGLEDLINETGISDFATLNYNTDKLIYQSNLSFDFSLLRDLQNLDWAEESLEYAKRYMNRGDKESAIQYLTTAIELDPLNKNAMSEKAKILFSQVLFF